MKLEIFGGPKHGGWSGHGEYEDGVDPALRPCPFCREGDIEVSNTHTPYYTASCQSCYAEGPRNDVGDAWRRRMSKTGVEALHRASFLQAIRDWNSWS